MKKLYELVTIETNNENCVILKPKKGSEYDLISTGYFTGMETYMRLTKGPQQICTVFYKNEESFTWYWGDGGYTCVGIETERKGKMIQECIEKDFGIQLRRSR